MIGLVQVLPEDAVQAVRAGRGGEVEDAVGGGYTKGRYATEFLRA
jgi:hypothetical protein